MLKLLIQMDFLYMLECVCVCVYIYIISFLHILVKTNKLTNKTNKQKTYGLH